MCCELPGECLPGNPVSVSEESPPSEGSDEQDGGEEHTGPGTVPYARPEQLGPIAHQQHGT